MDALLQRVAALSCWSETVDPQPLAGGLTNHNFRVRDAGQEYVVRVGDDLPEHGVLRSNEVNAARAAYRAGLGPEIIHVEPSIMVMRYVAGQALLPEQICQPAMLERLLVTLQCCHRQVAAYLQPGVLSFWVFQVNRSYISLLQQVSSPYCPDLPTLLEYNASLEQAVGPVHIVFSHNDMLAANFIDDGDRLWLLDWEYAGFNSPLFDLANLAANNALPQEQERWLLQQYFAGAEDERIWQRYQAMKCASLLREGLWSMVSEHYSKLDYDYTAYTHQNMACFEQAWLVFNP